MLNKIFIMGRLTRDPELRYTESGNAVVNFSLACERDFKEKDGSRATDFVECIAWRNTAEFVSKRFSKGRMAVVEGRLQMRDWKDKNGNNRRAAEIQVDNIYFGDSKPQDNGSYSGYAAQVGKFNSAPQFAEVDDEEDVPF
jgi:single-strand DNA-binding protein